MGSLSLLPLSPLSSLTTNHHYHRCYHLSPKPPCVKLTYSSETSSIKFPTETFSRKSSSNESQYVDEDGVVEDMDGYMNQLSLEYDSVWDTKPSWCQPWTITLTGALVIACSWIILHSVVITTLVLSVIGAWWYIFLYSYPKAYTEMIADRRKKVNNGVEDTFGITKS